jgi:alpha-L-fucosidase
MRILSIMNHDPRASARVRFAGHGCGLFIHYGLYARRGRGEWTMYHDRVPVAEYERLADDFAPDAFDADRITDLACEAGMRYVNLVACHHDGFCLWDSAVEPFNSVRACGRDLVREVGVQCARKGLDFFIYFTHALNWRHPHAFPRSGLAIGRPDHVGGDPRYVADSDWRAERFWAWSHACMAELCHLDVPVAGIWLDIIMAWYERPDLVPIEDTYRLIRGLRPDMLIAYKQGATGDEDFAAPEFRFASLGDRLRARGLAEAAARAERAWELNRGKHNEICMTLQGEGWGYVADARHRNADDLWGALAYAGAHRCNLLANVGPLPDGSLHADDVATLREVGRRIRIHGLPGRELARDPSDVGGTGAA